MDNLLCKAVLEDCKTKVVERTAAYLIANPETKITAMWDALPVFHKGLFEQRFVWEGTLNLEFGNRIARLCELYHTTEHLRKWLTS